MCRRAASSRRHLGEKLDNQGVHEGAIGLLTLSRSVRVVRPLLSPAVELFIRRGSRTNELV